MDGGPPVPFEVRDELEIEVEHKPGALARVLKEVARAGVDLRAFCAYGAGAKGTVLLVPADAAKAEAALRAAGFEKISKARVIVEMVDDRPGAGAEIAFRAADAGINLEHAYATAAGGGRAAVVLAAGENVARLAEALAAS